MMTEQDPLVGRFKIVPVAQTLGGCGAPVVQAQHFGGDETGVKTIADQEGTGTGENQPDAVDGFAAMDGDAAQT